MKFNIRRIIVIVVLVIGVISAVAIGANLMKPKPKYNLLLISVDTLRADHMGVYGYPKNTTPNIDKWAKGATVFTNVRTIVPATFPSFVSLMTGKSQFETKIFNNFGIVFNGIQVKGGHPLDNKAVTLAEILKRNGYKTAAFVTNLALKAENTNLDKGFDEYNFLDDDPYAEYDKSKYSKFILDSINWLGRNKKDKFFLWVHLISPHAPYTPPSEFQCKLDSKYCQQIKERGLKNIEDERKKYEGCQKKPLPKDIISLMENLYDGEIALDDSLIGKILDSINTSELNKKTVVVFYGDHGEGFDHNYYFIHTHALYDSSTKIPLIIKRPNVTKLEDRNSSFFDNTQILPTVLNLLGNNNSFSKSYKPSQYIYATNDSLTKYSVQNDRYKFIYSFPYSCLINGLNEELYDLKNDSRETKNLIYDEQDVAKLLKSELMKYLTKYNLPDPIRYESDEQASQEQIDIFEELKSLGY